MEFLRFRNKEIKLVAIDALGDFKDQLANRVLMGFLEDADEDIRIQAALKLNPVEEQSRIRRLIRETHSKAFRSKSAKEIAVILSYLGRTKTPEAAHFLKRALLRPAFWPSSPSLSIRLGAVAGLESLGTAEAKKALESGTQRGRKAIREACARALVRLAAGPAVNPGEKTA
jgi:HEAT repeat protein